MNQRLTRQERLTRKREFDRVFREGRSFRFSTIVVKAALNGLAHPRLGISIGRRVGGAVRRNRIKRLIRESFRLNKQHLSVACDVVVIPRAAWRDLSLRAVEPLFREALTRIGKAFAPG